MIHRQMHMYICTLTVSRVCKCHDSNSKAAPRRTSHIWMCPHLSTPHTPHHTIPSLLCSDLFHWASIARKRVSYAVSLTPLQRPSTCQPQLCAKSNFKYKICIHKCLWRGRRGGLWRRWWRCLCLRTKFSFDFARLSSICAWRPFTVRLSTQQSK